MSIFNRYPYTDFHRLNADWILEKVKEAAEDAHEAAEAAAASASQVSEAVRYTEQQLTSSQQEQARTNIGAASAAEIPDFSDVVRTSVQTLSAGQKQQARTNIGAASAAEIPDVSDVVRTSVQTLSAGQKQQARTNIGAAAAADVPEILVVHIAPNENDTGYECDKTYSEISSGVGYYAPIFVFQPIGSNFWYVSFAEYDTSTHIYVASTFIEINDSSFAQPSYNYRVTLNDQDVISVNYLEFRVLPNSNIGDQNKLLQVSDRGKPVWASVLPSVVTDSSSSTISLTPAANTIYKYGELTSLTITTPPATGEYMIVFTSGSTPTSTTIPATILGLENFTAEANTLYEINVLDNRAVVGSWAVSAS